MKIKICKKALVILLIMQSCIVFSQQFGNLENVENLFKLTKVQVESSLIKKYGYYRSATDKSGIVTYSRVGERGVIYYANVFYKKDKLKSIAWEDNVHIAIPIIGNIYNNSDYEIDNDKSNSSVGIFVYRSDSKKFQVAIFRTEPNVRAGKIVFSLEKIN